MKKVLQVIGLIAALGFSLNVLGVIDFKLCIDLPGGCTFNSNVHRPVLTRQST